MKGQYDSNLTLLKLGCCAAIFLYSFWLSTQYAQAKTVLFEDSFDGQIGTNWQLVQDRQVVDAQKPCLNKFSPASWVQLQGKLVLEIEGPSCMMDFGPTNIELRGLAQYSISTRMTLKESTQMDRAIVFLWMNERNWYDVKFFGTTLMIEKVVNGVSYQLENSIQQFPFQANREYHIVIDVSRDQHISVFVDGQLVLDVADHGPYMPPLERQFFTLRGAVGAVSRSVNIFDDVLLETNQATPTLLNLNVLLWKQSDPSWKNLEYDSAHLWSSIPTMNRWGCAVTSMAMILRYYGISQLPSGDALTPQSLNVWLREQVDGYFNGNVNWLAFTRLSQQVSTKLGTPKLEFSRTDGTLAQITAFATQELNANKPVILGYPGHFFVADGIDRVNNTLLTKDPFYSYQKLNQRPTLQEVNTIRRFQPSHTDLSYILLNTSPNLDVTVKNQDGDDVVLEKVTEYMSDPTGETAETSPLSQQFLIRKPSTGFFIMKVSQAIEGPYSLDTFSYDVAGNVVGEHFQGKVGPDEKNLQIEFRKEVLLSASPSPSPSPSPVAPSPTVSPSLSPTTSPNASHSPTSSPGTIPESHRANHRNLSKRLVEEIRRLEVLLHVLRRYRIFIQRSTYQRFFQRLERLKEQTNWRGN